MNSVLVLGEVAFSDFEVPEHFVIGGKQRLVVHALPGGGRVVDAMGADDAPISWAGVFSGQQAAERVRLLERMRRGGRPQTLTWNAWRYKVVVQEFEAEIASSWWIPYRVRLCVVLDNARDRADWLDAAVVPTLTVGLLTAAGLDVAIGVAGAALSSANLGQAIGAAGTLAQYATARAYGLVTA